MRISRILREFALFLGMSWGEKGGEREDDGGRCRAEGRASGAEC